MKQTDWLARRLIGTRLHPAEADRKPSGLTALDDFPLLKPMPLACPLRPLFFSIVLMLAAMPLLASAQVPEECRIGQVVGDDGSQVGTVVSGRGGLCLVKLRGGQTQAWIAADRLHVVSPTASRQPQPAGTSRKAAAGSGAPQGIVVLRPRVIINRLVFRADALGHIMITAKANGAPVRFMVDTGATLVSLTPTDAASAGLQRKQLTFNQTVQTGNGAVQAALATLRQLRIGQLEMDNVKVAVIETLKQSVLGMSFLKRLKGFEMHDGTLRLTW